MNSDVGKVFSAEWLKVKRRRMTIIMPFLMGFVTVVLLFGLSFAARRQWIGIPSGYYLAAVTIEWIINITILVAVVVTCFHISREFSWGTIKSAWVRPVTRSSWYAGKVLSAYMAIAALFLFAVTIVIILSALRFGFTDLVEGNYLVHSAASMGWHLVLTIGLSIWVLWAVVAMAAMLATFFNHSGSAIATGLGLGICMIMLSIFPVIKPYLLSSLVSLPTDQMIAMAKGLPLPLSWGQLVWHTLVGAGIWMSVPLVIGYVFIQRKEITL